MSKAKKMWIIAAIICSVLGCIIVGAAVASVGFDFTKFDTSQREIKTYTVSEPFENIDIRTTECDIVFLPAEKDTCEIVCAESDKITHTVSVENNTIKITRRDMRKWYEHIGISFSISDYEIRVYLPQGEYNKLYASSVSGDITIPDTFTFCEVDLSTTSGEISFASETKNTWNCKTVSGDISAKNMAGGSVDIKTTSGDIELEETQADTVHLVTTSGDISLENTVAETELFIKTTSGEVELESCDSADITIKTTSGDVEGALRSEKQFITHTTSGDIQLPESTSASQKCTINTTSGDIRFMIES